jgi:hypothetical protein
MQLSAAQSGTSSVSVPDTTTTVRPPQDTSASSSAADITSRRDSLRSRDRETR